jgi:hypothetical protein
MEDNESLFKEQEDRHRYWLDQQKEPSSVRGGYDALNMKGFSTKECFSNDLKLFSSDTSMDASYTNPYTEEQQRIHWNAEQARRNADVTATCYLNTAEGFSLPSFNWILLLICFLFFGLCISEIVTPKTSSFL